MRRCTVWHVVRLLQRNDVQQRPLGITLTGVCALAQGSQFRLTPLQADLSETVTFGQANALQSVQTEAFQESLVQFKAKRVPKVDFAALRSPSQPDTQDQQDINHLELPEAEAHQVKPCSKSCSSFVAIKSMMLHPCELCISKCCCCTLAVPFYATFAQKEGPHAPKNYKAVLAESADTHGRLSADI